MANFFSKFFSKKQPDIILQTTPPHVHIFELLSKTIAEPSSINKTEKTLLGCTSFLFQCTECGKFETVELLGSEESTLTTLLAKVDEQGPISILRNGKKYLLGPLLEDSRPSAGALPVR